MAKFWNPTGLERGPVIAHRVLESVEDPAADPWPVLAQAIGDAAHGEGPAAGLIAVKPFAVCTTRGPIRTR